jgi:CheY-like chemotaxis protein/GAF domain-containing protein
MSDQRPCLITTEGLLAAHDPQHAALRAAFDVREVESEDAARRLAVEQPGSLLLLPGDDHYDEQAPLDLSAATLLLETIGEGVGVVDRDGSLAWANERLREYDAAVRTRFTETCGRALEQFNQSGAASVPITARPGQKYTFDEGDAHFEMVVSIASDDGTEEQVATAVVGVLWEITASRRIQSKLDAIDAAGSELLRIETESIGALNMADRLKLLEEKIVRYVNELLSFDNFEIRLIDRETNQLELVIAKGISPLRIGEVLYAEKENNGISGFVAVTGKSYLCRDTASDPRYREGLADAASSLTVPLRLHDRVIGVFNIESNTPDAFDENDRRFAEIFGRYIAMSMHILDLLVVERYTTNEQVAQNVLSELGEPLGEIASRAAALRSGVEDPDIREGLDRILESTGSLRRRLEGCTVGPRSILGAEQELHRIEPDPAMVGKNVLVADNEEAIREAIGELLQQKGCNVTICAGGTETLDQLRAADAVHHIYDLVIADIRMPDHNGYEVFRAAKEICADTPVILITGFGYDPHHSIVRASQEGLQAFLFKPLKASQLIEAVSRALEPSD